MATKSERKMLNHFQEANMRAKENRMKIKVDRSDGEMDEGMDGEMDEETNLDVRMDEIACSWLLHNHTLAGGFVEPW